MARTLREVIASLPAERRAKVEARAAELIAEEMSLRDLRKAIGETQTTVARRLKVGQEAVSKVEMRRDMKISTLHGFIDAMHGSLTLLAEFPDRPAVRLRLGELRLGDTAPRRKRDRRAAEADTHAT
jgi:transcriptional regulator with XRE-family HTH domain